MSLPSAGVAYKKIDAMLGNDIDTAALNRVLEHDLEPSALKHECGLLGCTAPQLVNMLGRGQSWDQILSVSGQVVTSTTAATPKNSAKAGIRGGLESDDESDDEPDGQWTRLGNDADSLDEDNLWKFALTPKVLLTFMMARFAHQDRLRLATWARDMYPMPLVYRHPDEDGRLVVDPLHMQMLIKGTFLASVPFGTKGNSKVLNRLFRCAFEESPSSISPLHAGSVDVKLTKNIEVEDHPIEPFHIVDFHTGSGGEGLTGNEHAAVLNSLRFAQYFLIHFPLKSGKPGWEEAKDTVLNRIKPFVQSMFRNGAPHGEGKRVLFLARDVDESDPKLEARKNKLAEEFDVWAKDLGCDGALVFQAVPDFSNLPMIQTSQHLGRVFETLRRHCTGAAKFTDYWSFLKSLEAACSADAGAPGLQLPAASRLDHEQARENHGTVVQSLAGVSSDWSEELKWSATPFVMEHAEQQSGMRKEGLADILNRRRHMIFTPFMSCYLQSVCKSATNLHEWKRQLVTVAEMQASRLVELNAIYLKDKREYESITEAVAKEMKIYGEKSCINTAREIDSRAITAEKLWRELEEFYDCYDYIEEVHRKTMTFSQISVVDAFTACMQRGFAMELLDGDHIVVHPEFLAAVFEKFAKNGGDAGCRTISILGPQSSGKSTLANALWGGDFATSAGRCTKGLYASVFPTSFKGLPYLLFLDTEGLCSIENDAEFDQKLALLAIAMSDVILINVRGDIDSKVSSVLQMAVFCLREMSILADQRTPELVFVQRDMTDFSKAKSETTMNTLEQNMRDATKLLRNPDGSQVELRDILHFDRESLFLMPSAFKPLDKVLYSHSGEVQIPNPGFGQASFKLRQRIVELAMSGRCNVGSIQQWGQRFCTVKATIDKFKDLANFSGALALQTRQMFDEQVKRLLDIHVYGTDAESAANSMSATLTAKQVEMEAEVNECLKRTYPTGAVDRARALDEIKQRFENYCSKQISGITGDGGALVSHFKTFCATNKAITAEMQREGIETLRGRVKMFVNSRKATFETVHQRNQANNTFMGVFEELRAELGELRRGAKNSSKDEAVRLFDTKFVEKKDKLLQVLKTNHPNYKDIVHRSVESFAKTTRISAISLDAITAEVPDTQLDAIRFNQKGEDPRIDLPLGLPKQFEASCSFVSTSSFQKSSAGFLKKKRSFEGIWSYTDPDGRTAQFLIAPNDKGQLSWQGEYKGKSCTGPLMTDSITGTVFATLANASGQHAKFRVIPGSFHRRACSMQAQFVDPFGTGGDFFTATKLNLQEGGLSNICAFFDVVEPKPDGESKVSFLNPVTWVELFLGGGTSALQEVMAQTKANVLIEAYVWLGKMIGEFVEKADEELSNITVILKELYETLSSPGSGSNDDTTQILWEFTAVMKNECLRCFCVWVEAYAESRRTEKDQDTIRQFEDEMVPLRKNFINAVTQVQDDKNKAAIFADEFWIFVTQKTKAQMQNRAVSEVTQEFSNPEACQEYCDNLYIGKFGTPEGRTADDVFRYITDPAGEMRQHVCHLCDEKLKTSTASARTAWNNMMENMKARFITLCDAVQALHRNNHMECRAGDQGMDEPSEDAAKKTFQALMSLINTGSAAMQYGACVKQLSTDVQVLGEDHGKYVVTINNVDSISNLEAFLSALRKNLEGHTHEESLSIKMEEQKGTILSQWVGCQEKCPYCRKKCSLAKHDSSVKHKCAFHQPIGFGGVKLEATGKPLFITCDEMDNQGRGYLVKDTCEVLPFPQHLAKCHPEWEITTGGVRGSASFNTMAAGYEKVWGNSTFRGKLCAHHGLERIPWSEGVDLAKRSSYLTKVQVALVLDTTSSMKGEIVQCKSDCIDMVTQIGNTFSRLCGRKVDVEFAFCGYKDYGDGGHLQRIDFQGPTGYHLVKDIIAKQVASGGGDAPEDMLSAFNVVCNFNWEDRHNNTVKRVMILIADAPCHGKAYGDFEDDHPEDGPKMPAVLRALTDRKIDCCFSIISPYVTKKMENAFSEHWKINGGRDCSFITFSSRREAGDQISENVLESIQTLIQSAAS